MNFCEKAAPEAITQDWNLPDSICDEIDYLKLRSVLFASSTDAANAKNDALADSLAVVAHSCSMGLQLTEPGTPFKPLAVWADGSRTVSPDDLKEKHLGVLEKFAAQAANCAIQARLYDLLWVKTRPSKRDFAERAIKSYIELASQIRRHHIDKITYASIYLERAIQLWRQIGSDARVRASLEAEMEACMELSQPEPTNFIRFQFFDLIQFVFEDKDLGKWVKIGEEMVKESLEQKHFEKARSYLESIRALYKAVKDSANSALLKERHTDLFVAEAREMKQAGVDPMILQNLYNKAIEACRNTPGKAKLAKELHSDLLEIQKGIPGNLKGFSEKVDLQPAIEQTIEAIQKQTFENAIKIVALKSRPTKKSHLYAEAERQIKSYPLQSLFTTVILDEKGKVVAQRPGMGSTPEEHTAAVRSRASQNMLMGFELKGVVLTWAQREINNRMDFDDRFIDSLLYPNPFVPWSRRAQFKRGIITGLKGDWISSVSILIPQLENSLRHVMQLAGHNMSTFDTDVIHQDKDLNSFIYTDEFGALLGEDMQFQLQVLLCDKTGLNLRNKFAHGLLTDSAALGGSSAYLWALTLLICLDFQARYYAANVAANSEEATDPASEAEKPPTN